MAIRIISDSSCDLGLEYAKKNDIEIVPFYVSFDSQNYMKEHIDIQTQAFYQKMVENPTVFPKSSLPPIQDYIEVFTKYAKQGDDIICLCITSKFSGSYNSAKNAAEIVKQDYPNVKITAIDTMVNTVLQGLVVREAVRMRNNGVSYEDLVNNINEIKKTGRIIFTIGSMDYLLKGGRIGKVLTGAVSKFRIMPIITLTDGEIFPSGICRSRKASVDKVIEKFKSYIINEKINPNDYVMAIGYGYDIDEAIEFKKAVYEASKSFCDGLELEINQIGSTIAVHTGPQALGIGLVKKYDC